MYRELRPKCPEEQPDIIREWDSEEEEDRGGGECENADFYYGDHGIEDGDNDDGDAFDDAFDEDRFGERNLGGVCQGGRGLKQLSHHCL